MVTLQEYLRNPCGLLSIPYYKAINLTLPQGVLVIHDSQWNAEVKYSAHQRFFRLIHNLHTITTVNPTYYTLVVATSTDYDDIVEIINACYDNIDMSIDRLINMSMQPTYCPQLWVMAKDSEGMSVGCALADYDSNSGEVSLEWVQVLPRYRGKGIAQALVQRLLAYASTFARFTTVSGDVDNVTNPQALYRKCGFIGNDIWHIVRIDNERV
ncbi:MAG: GNAT family N-acetyltransferase [Clostridia bacterium]|nr:GNAT family N-acetyltransferase [Clostridia bacterium]